MRHVLSTDDVLAIFFDRLEYPLAANVEIGTTVEDRVIFDWHLQLPVVKILCHTLEFRFGAFPGSKMSVPWDGMVSHILGFRFQKRLLIFVRT